MDGPQPETHRRPGAPLHRARRPDRAYDGNDAEAAQLLPQCDAFDIKELYAKCKKMPGKG